MTTTQLPPNDSVEQGRAQTGLLLFLQSVMEDHQILVQRQRQAHQLALFLTKAVALRYMPTAFFELEDGDVADIEAWLMSGAKSVPRR